MKYYDETYLADGTNVLILDFNPTTFRISNETNYSKKQDDIIFFKTAHTNNKIFYGHLCTRETSTVVNNSTDNDNSTDDNNSTDTITNLEILIPFLQTHDNTKTITIVDLPEELVVNINEPKNMKAVHPDKIISFKKFLNDNLSTLDDKPIEIYLNTQFRVCGDRETVQTIVARNPTHDYRIFEIKTYSHCKLFRKFILSIYNNKDTLPLHGIVNIIDSNNLNKLTFKSLFRDDMYLIIIDNKENKVETNFPIETYLNKTSNHNL